MNRLLKKAWTKQCNVKENVTLNGCVIMVVLMHITWDERTGTIPLLSAIFLVMQLPVAVNQKRQTYKERQDGVSRQTCRSSFSPRATRTTQPGTDTAVLIESCAKTHNHAHITLSKVSLFNSLPHTHIITYWKLHCISVKEEAGYWASHKSLSHLKSPTLTHLSVTGVAATELLRVAQRLSHTGLFYISTDLS